MLARLIHFSLEFRVIVLLLAVSLIAIGAYTVQESPWDVFPEFAPPQIVIQTEAPGLSTEEVEQLITIPVESAVNGVSHIKTLRSSSVAGLSVVTAIFDDGTDILDARQLVSERLNEASTQLPKLAGAPRMTPLAASTSRLLMLGMTSDSISAMELRTIADWTFRRRLQAVRGVAHVEVFGGEVKQYQVLVDPLKLRQYQLTLDEVTLAAQNATGFGGAGYLETPNQRLTIQQRTKIVSPEDLAAVPVVMEEGVPITLGQVADVAVGAADKPGDATINGQPGVLMLVHKQPSFNTLTVSDNVQQAISELGQTLPAGVELHPVLFRQATFIERAIGNLSSAILIGCMLVILILIAFLFQWRTVVISLTAIPLSLLGAILVLRGLGFSLNAMTLGGLAIALGEVVDDAIVDVENVLRRLRENARTDSPRSALQVVLDASLEVRSAVVYASFIVVLIFVPVFFMGGLAGTFFWPLGMAYISAILVSLLVALIVTPAMCLLMLRGTNGKEERDPFLVRGLTRIYRQMLPLFLRFRKTTLATSVVMITAATAVIPFLGGEFLPDFRESNFVVFMVGSPDESLPEAVRVGSRVANRLQAIPGVLSVAQQVGRADLSEDTWGPNISEIWVVIDEAADYDSVLKEVRESVENVPGHRFQVKQFLRERIDEVITGSTADLVVRIVGPDLNVLRDHAQSVTKVMQRIKGVADLQIEQQVEVPQIQVMIRPQEVARYGFSVGQLNQDIQTLLRGTVVGQVYEQDRVFDVIVRAAPETRESPELLGQLQVDSLTGESIPLHAVASINLVNGINTINREQASRRLLVTCNLEGRDVATATEDIQQQLSTVEANLPPGYHLEFGGEYEARSRAQTRLLLLSGVALLGIFALLYVDLRSTRLALLVMVSVPLACVGGVASILATGGDISLGSLVGFVTVFGVAIRNGILLISHYQHLQQEGMRPGAELILRGASERLAPILMTASSTALALLPLIVLGNLPGHEIEYPMAIVIVGGLVSSTFLTLVLLPILYASFGQNQKYVSS